MTSPRQVSEGRFFICCDGTWQDGINNSGPLTNVAQLARYISPVSDDGFYQIVYYDSGVGNTNAVFAPTIDGATGRGISAKIRNAYSFLSHNYNFATENDPGYSGPVSDRRLVDSQMDEILLVGFSRGAFTVQCLASLISDIGLLHKDSLHYLRHLFVLWANQELQTGEGRLGDLMKEKLSQLDIASEIRRQVNVEIKALAVWDTVSALGISISPFRFSPKPLLFVEGKIPDCVQHAFHALALNENRRQFKPCVWSKWNAATEVGTEPTTVKQCWFLGSHSDIGGGNKDSGLSTISFVWMVSQLKSLDVTFDSIYPNELKFVNYLQWEQEISRLWGTVKSRLSADSKITSSGNVKQAGVCWYILGVRRRGKYLDSRKTEAGQGEEESQLGQETHDRAADVRDDLQRQGAPGGNLKGKKKAPAETSRSNQFVHFSVRVLMGKGRNTCRVLRKWKTSNTGQPPTDSERIFWERERGHNLAATVAKLQLPEDTVYQEEWEIWQRSAEGRLTSPQQGSSRKHRKGLRRLAFWRPSEEVSREVEEVTGDFLFGTPPSLAFQPPRPSVKYPTKSSNPTAALALAGA